MLITNADELINFSKSEEESMEKIVKPLAESGVTCVVSGGKIGELALHMLDKYQVRTFIKLFLLFAVYFRHPLAATGVIFASYKPTSPGVCFILIHVVHHTVSSPFGYRIKRR